MSEIKLLKVHRWSDGRELHGPWFQGHGHRLSGSENAIENYYAMTVAQAEQVVEALKRAIDVGEQYHNCKLAPNNVFALALAIFLGPKGEDK